ncbi:MAG: NAD(P)-binding domain-containing protein, partial [Candidatus Omnitrophota bacterium]
MATINSKIGFIGCGNMGEALIRGLLDKRIVPKVRILASDARPARRRYIQKRYKIKVVSSNKAIAKESDIIILAVKPQNIDEA